MTAVKRPEHADDLDRPTSEEPDWVRQGIRVLLTEAWLFLTTAARYVTGPRRFAVEWLEGRRRLMHPAGFLVTTGAVVELALHVTRRLRGESGPSEVGLLRELAQTVRPYVIVVLAGVLAHIVYRILRSPRRVTSSVAMTFYGVAFAVLGEFVGKLAGNEVVSILAILPGLALFSLALAGLHRMPWYFALAIGLAASIGSIDLVKWVYELF